MLLIAKLNSPLPKSIHQNESIIQVARTTVFVFPARILGSVTPAACVRTRERL